MRFAAVARDGNFNPRSPHGERRNAVGGGKECLKFQPTLPARGATMADEWKAWAEEFQPTLPARGATPFTDCIKRYYTNISTHAPRTGSDPNGIMHYMGVAISTHAPRTGSDEEDDFQAPYFAHFNPRSPHGERHVILTIFNLRFYFNPRSPHGERRNPAFILWRAHISTHAPRTGSDEDVLSEIIRPNYFNPRSPHGERLMLIVQRIASPDISTHAPRTGSDFPGLLTCLIC